MPSPYLSHPIATRISLFFFHSLNCLSLAPYLILLTSTQQDFILPIPHLSSTSVMIPFAMTISSYFLLLIIIPLPLTRHILKLYFGAVVLTTNEGLSSSCFLHFRAAWNPYTANLIKTYLLSLINLGDNFKIHLICP